MIRQSINENEINFLGDIPLTNEEERSLIWLSSWETSTVKNIISAFEKANNK